MQWYTRLFPICQNQIQGLFKDFYGPHKGYIRTKWNQTGTIISIYKRRKLSQQGPGQRPSQKWILCTFEVRKKPSGTPFSSINWFGHGILENQIQALSRTFRQIQGLSRTHKSPGYRVIRLKSKCSQCDLENLTYFWVDLFTLLHCQSEWIVHKTNDVKWTNDCSEVNSDIWHRWWIYVANFMKNASFWDITNLKNEQTNQPINSYNWSPCLA